MTVNDSTRWLSTRWIALFGMAVVLAGGYWLGQRTTKAHTDADRAPALSSAGPGAAGFSSDSGATPARKVEVVAPERAAMSRSLDVPATIEAFEVADLYANTSGYVSEVRKDIGDRVKQGDVLAIIDVPEMADELRHAEAVHQAKEARLVQMRARVETARAELRRFEADKVLKRLTFDRKELLRKGNAIPEQELDQSRGELDVSQAQVEVGKARLAGAEADVVAAEADVAMARAAVARLRTLMEYATIRAPFDGVVSRRFVDRGMLVQPSTGNMASRLFTVERIDLLRVYIDVPESDVPHVRIGSLATVKPYGMPGMEVEGAVTRIASSLNPGTRTMRAEIDLDNPEDTLMHGMYAQVTLELDRRENVLIIPAATLLTEKGATFVFTVKGDRATRTDLQIGHDDGIRVEVQHGLDDDALVILAGKGLVSDGAPVRPVLKKQPASSTASTNNRVALSRDQDAR
jgi:RND family efflux transporter MFP subunit